MTHPAIRKALSIMAFISFFLFTHAQGPAVAENASFKKSEKKPYKILTSGKRITIKSNLQLKSLLIWSARGHRVVEQKNMDVQEYTYNITISENIFFILLELENGKRYTEKIGVSSSVP